MSTPRGFEKLKKIAFQDALSSFWTWMVGDMFFSTTEINVKFLGKSPPDLPDTSSWAWRTSLEIYIMNSFQCGDLNMERGLFKVLTTSVEIYIYIYVYLAHLSHFFSGRLFEFLGWIISCTCYVGLFSFYFFFLCWEMCKRPTTQSGSCILPPFCLWMLTPTVVICHLI